MGRKEWANIVLCLIVFGAVCYGVNRIAGASDIVELFNPEAKASVLAVDFGEKVALNSFVFEINGVSKDVKAGFAITNGSHKTIRDMVISCDFFDKENDLRGRGRWVVYKNIPPSQSDDFLLEDRRYISYLVDPESISCKIVDLKITGAEVGSHNSDGH